MNLDITFCSKTDCENRKCKRNQNTYKVYLKDREIWIGNFEECKFWEKKKGADLK